LFLRGGVVDHGLMVELRRIALGNREESDAVRVISGKQQGVIARPQLLTAGVTNAAIDRALRSGRLYRVYQGVY
jgi:hypothetical protein